MLVTLQQEVPFLLSKLSYGSRDDSYIINFLNRRKRFLPVNFIVKKQIPTHQFFFYLPTHVFWRFLQISGSLHTEKGCHIPTNQANKSKRKVIHK